MKTILKLAIQDANVLIDLVKLPLLSECFDLPYQFVTTDLVFAELYPAQRHQFSNFIATGRLQVISLSTVDLISVTQLMALNVALSLQDCSALHYAEKNEALLVTSDNPLRKIAISRGVQVCGLLRIFDELITAGIITPKKACILLSQLMSFNTRLPQKECLQRQDKWCN